MSGRGQARRGGGGFMGMGEIDPVLVIIAFVVAIGFSIYQWWSRRASEVSDREKALKKITSKKRKPNSSGQGIDQLAEHSGEFNKKEIVTVQGVVHSAIGYGLANCILIEGEKNCILIDTMESYEAAEDVKKAFEEKTSKKPICAIILTHFHGDHCNGLDVFLRDNPNIHIYAHETLPGYFKQLLNVRGAITYIRAVYQFGTELNKDKGHENSGIGFNLKFDGKAEATLEVKPTQTVKDKLKISEAGIDLELYHAPGETNDQMIVWWPKKKILFPADNIYRAFPNLYAIRGTMARDTLLWVKAVDLMRTLEPEFIVPQHTRPLEGRDVIMSTLTAYRDAIQIVHDQTVRYMNKGLYPNEIIRLVRLPDHLSTHPYLQEFYGTVEWSVKAVFTNYMGWFSGKASELHPLAYKEEATLLVDLAGNAKQVFEKLKQAYDKEQYQWAVQLSDVLLEVKEYVTEAKIIKAQCLRLLADGEVSACGRNWYLTEALVTEGLNIKLSQEQRIRRVKTAPMPELFLTLTVMLDFEKSIDVVETAHFNFTDTKENIVVKIRKGVAELLVNPVGEIEADVKVTVTNDIWREIMCKERSPLVATVKGELKIEPFPTRLATFMGYFDTD